MGAVSSVNVAVVSDAEWTGRIGRSGIDKRPAGGPVRLTESGVSGDTVCDTDNHGRWFQAAYAFDAEELDFWSGELGKDLVAGNAGENLTLTGCASTDAVIGERWAVGDAVLRVTGPRQPCRVFAGFWDVQRLVKRFTERGRTGTYLAVERAGEVRAGDEVRVLSRPEHGVTVAEVFAAQFHDRPDLADRVPACAPDLPEPWRAKVTRA